MITNVEARIIDAKFDDAYDLDNTDEKRYAVKLLLAWKEVYRLMERENKFTDDLGSDILDWQIGNWVQDVTMALYNAGMYFECIEVNEQILKIEWKGDTTNLFHENAKRDIADLYASIGDYKTCINLYEKYLKEDPLWGWAWIGYYRQVHEDNDAKFEQILDDLYNKIKSGVDFRDKEDLYYDLKLEYTELGNKERAQYFSDLLKEFKEEPRITYYFSGLN